MTSPKVKRISVLPVLALASIALALPLSSWADSAKKTTEGPPIVATGSVTRASGSSATLEGTIAPRTLVTTYYFQYGPTSTYGQQTATVTLTPPATGSGIVTVKVEQSVTGFLPGYHYRLVASNAKGTGVGHDHVYTVKSTKSDFVLPKTFLPVTLGGTFTITGTLTGSANAHREIVLHAVCWCELDLSGERFWRVRAYYDAHSVAVELGLLPRPGSWRRRAVLALQGCGLWGGG